MRAPVSRHGGHRWRWLSVLSSCVCVCVQEGSGVVGIVLTVLLFVVLVLVALFVLYTYLVKLHLDGRLLDLYRRLCAPESAFVIPHDMEVRSCALEHEFGACSRTRCPERCLCMVYDGRFLPMT